MEKNQQNQGWYIVNLPCYELNYKYGGEIERSTNWRVLATSQEEAYQKATKLAKWRGMFRIAPINNCQIDYWGELNIFTEMILTEDGLI